MEAFEQFLGEWRNTVLFAFSIFTLLFTIVRLYGFCQNRINKVVEEAVTTALIDQRQNYQAQAIDQLLVVIKDQSDCNIRYGEALVDGAVNAALCKQLLDNNNINAV